MSGYLSYEEYQEKGLCGLEEGEFDALSTYASRVVDAYTFRAIHRYGLMDDPRYAAMVKDAVAFQVDFMSRLGEDRALGVDAGEGAAAASESETIGNYTRSVSHGSGARMDGSAKAYVGTMQVSPLAVDVLAPIRAMGRRIDAC